MGGVDRRVLGVAVIVGAVLGLLVVNHANGRDVQGVASAPPLLPLPPAGSCLLQAGADFSVVPCTDRHTSEVAVSRAAMATDAPLACDGPPTEIPTHTIGEVSWSYWTFPLDSQRVTFGGPTGWQACVTGLVPPSVRSDSEPAGFRGTIAELADPANRPVDLRVCFNSATDDLESMPPGASCRLRHGGEVLGVAWVKDPTDAGLAASCRGLAAALIGSERPVAGGDLLIRTGSKPLVPGTESGGNTAFVSCGVQAPGDSQLVGSVIGLGTGPIPFG
ncbi:MAG: hypothetical protein M3Z00_04315 [Actinomycetota bacterium]|nr:hypothetical protein [Actinomycetota bacterium]